MHEKIIYTRIIHMETVLCSKFAQVAQIHGFQRTDLFHQLFYSHRLKLDDSTRSLTLLEEIQSELIRKICQSNKYRDINSKMLIRGDYFDKVHFIFIFSEIQMVKLKVI